MRYWLTDAENKEIDEITRYDDPGAHDSDIYLAGWRAGLELAAKICESFQPNSGDYENYHCRWAALDRAAAIREKLAE